jgi:predicted tellurium resistance membrane protein TerC
MFGSGLLAHIVHRHHLFVWAGGGLLGYIGLDMVLADPVVAPYVTWSTTTFLGFTLPISLVGSVVVLQTALLTRRRAARLAGQVT